MAAVSPAWRCSIANFAGAGKKPVFLKQMPEAGYFENK